MKTKRLLLILLALFMFFNAVVFFLGAGGNLPEGWIQERAQDSGLLTLVAWLCVMFGLGLIVASAVSGTEGKE